MKRRYVLLGLSSSARLTACAAFTGDDKPVVEDFTIASSVPTCACFCTTNTVVASARHGLIEPCCSCMASLTRVRRPSICRSQDAPGWTTSCNKASMCGASTYGDSAGRCLSMPSRRSSRSSLQARINCFSSENTTCCSSWCGTGYCISRTDRRVLLHGYSIEYVKVVVEAACWCWPQARAWIGTTASRQ